MAFLVAAFKVVSVIFPFLAIGTGAQGLFTPVAFAKTFGLPIEPPSASSQSSSRSSGSATKASTPPYTASYVSLMGIRQLSTGVVLGVFAYQKKYTESATMLAIIGVTQAGTDGLFLAAGGNTKAGLFHALPGAIISGLAVAYLLLHD